MALFADGHRYATIAQELGIKHSTVKAHVRNIMAKLGATNMPQATAIWMKVAS